MSFGGTPTPSSPPPIAPGDPNEAQKTAADLARERRMRERQRRGVASLRIEPDQAGDPGLRVPPAY